MVDENESFPFDDDALSVNDFVAGVDEAQEATEMQAEMPDVIATNEEEE